MEISKIGTQKKRCDRKIRKHFAKGKIYYIHGEKFCKSSKSQGFIMGYGRVCGVFAWILNNPMIYVMR